MYLNIYIYMYINKYLWIYAYICAYIYEYIYMHTHTHTHTYIYIYIYIKYIRTVTARSLGCRFYIRLSLSEMDCLPRLLNSICSWYLIAICPLAGSLNRCYHFHDRVSLGAMANMGLLHSPRNSGTHEPEPYLWLQFNVLLRSQWD